MILPGMSDPNKFLIKNSNLLLTKSKASNLQMTLLPY